MTRSNPSGEGTATTSGRSSRSRRRQAAWAPAAAQAPVVYPSRVPCGSRGGTVRSRTISNGRAVGRDHGDASVRRQVEQGVDHRRRDGRAPLAPEAGDERDAIWSTSRRFASSTPTNPTGMPTTHAGCQPAVRPAGPPHRGPSARCRWPRPRRRRPARRAVASRRPSGSDPRPGEGGRRPARRGRRGPRRRAARPGRGGCRRGASRRRSITGAPARKAGDGRVDRARAEAGVRGEVEVGRGVDHPPHDGPLGRVRRHRAEFAVDDRERLGHDRVADVRVRRAIGSGSSASPVFAA